MLMIFAIVVLFAGSALVAYVLLSDPETVKAKNAAKAEARKEKNAEALKTVHEYISKSVEKRQQSGGFTLFKEEELELSNIQLTVGQMILYTVSFSLIGGGLVGFLVSPVLGFFSVFVFVFLSTRIVKFRLNKTRRAFQRQLEQALRVISSSLSSGQSLNGAIISVADDADQPMAGEMSRIVNESRMGRDLIEAFYEVARRMDSEDFEWFTSAAELQRATGGDLTMIIETVAETIRERSELREKIRAHSAEGRSSAYVLMGLPVVLGGVYTVLNPGYMNPLIESFTGKIMLAGSLVLYIISALWMRKIVDIKA